MEEDCIGSQRPQRTVVPEKKKKKKEWDPMGGGSLIDGIVN
jgi:hypothetical protein